ncbi:dihydropteroate synthase [Reichenbachiella sp. 5M10]|uniref:dihydropteroate synthase n=1 Tax=Reichenbachiella sp. 5M10 TaxID=1889772 RepID=UPI000C145BA4|nr:dihydropteroate synthase [Reichenbachiella sp. 5M10]PIB34433.1 dihydropteroate synthase [Reichenbachiella sp. 5M10]
MDLSHPKIMGIVNVTQDSFYDGGKIQSDHDLLTQTEYMLKQGADILDVGAYSSRPGALEVSMEGERARAVSAVRCIMKEFPEAVVSIDSFRAAVVEACLEEGAAMINDISGCELDENMFALVSSRNVPYIMMHMRGNPETMQQMTDYGDLVSDIIDYFNVKLNLFQKNGVRDVIIDPGFGFAKTTEQNFELMRKLELLRLINVPVLCGVSRKSMIYKTLDCGPGEALNGTTALHMVSLMKGASILRVHDVKEAKEAVVLFEALKDK